MKMYLVYQDDVSDILREEKCNLMLTFASIKKGLEVTIPKGYPEVMIDSGGYQLQTGVKTSRTISVTSYATWLQYALEKYPEIVAYMNLDVINNTEQTLKNLEYLESEGLHPLPVWHPGEGDKLLEKYAKTHEYIALGGFVSGKANKIQIRHIFERVKTRYPDHKFHLLGIGLNASTSLINMRPYSVDFSTWQMVFRYGIDLVWGNDLLLHEKTMEEEHRVRVKQDREFRRKKVREVLKNLSLYAELLEEYKGEGVQSQFDLRL